MSWFQIRSSNDPIPKTTHIESLNHSFLADKSVHNANLFLMIFWTIGVSEWFAHVFLSGNFWNCVCVCVLSHHPWEWLMCAHLIPLSIPTASIHNGWPPSPLPSSEHHRHRTAPPEIKVPLLIPILSSYTRVFLYTHTHTHTHGQPSPVPSSEERHHSR
jgi:hypothetical protein